MTQLDKFMQEISEKSQFKEIWLSHISGAELCMLLNHDTGFAMWLAHVNDAGFTSRNPLKETTLTTQDMTVFEHGNGQQDEYPTHWTVSKDVLCEVAKHFIKTGQKSPSIHWHHDA